MRRNRIVARVLLGVTTLVSAASTATAETLPHVRPASPGARLLIDGTARDSPTVRGLIERVDQSDVIVYVQMTASPQIPSASTTLVTVTQGHKDGDTCESRFTLVRRSGTALNCWHTNFSMSSRSRRSRK